MSLKRNNNKHLEPPRTNNGKGFEGLDFERTEEKTILHSPFSILNSKAAFTLTEAIAVLVVLGIVAALTIPQVVRRQIEAANRTKIKKSMKVFDLFTNKIVVENDLKNNTALQNWATENDCENSLKYFKPVKFIPKENGDMTNCRFMTSDKVAWDLSKYPDATFSLDEEELDNPDSPITFKPHAHFDGQGILRVNDLGWELANGTAIVKDIEKMYNYPKKEKNETDLPKPYVIIDYMWKTYPTNCYKLGYDKSKWKSCTVPSIAYEGGKKVLSYHVLNEKGQVIEEGYYCNLNRECHYVSHALSDGSDGVIPIAETVDALFYNSEENPLFNEEYDTAANEYDELIEENTDRQDLLNLNICTIVDCNSHNYQAPAFSGEDTIDW